MAGADDDDDNGGRMQLIVNINFPLGFYVHRFLSSEAGYGHALLWADCGFMILLKDCRELWRLGFAFMTRCSLDFRFIAYAMGLQRGYCSRLFDELNRTYLQSWWIIGRSWWVQSYVQGVFGFIETSVTYKGKLRQFAKGCGRSWSVLSYTLGGFKWEETQDVCTWLIWSWQQCWR